MSHLISRRLIRGRHKNEVIADKIMSHFKPTSGNNHAPAIDEHVPARLFIPHKQANDVASFPFTVFLAIRVIILRNINIPIPLKTIPYNIAETGLNQR